MREIKDKDLKQMLQIQERPITKAETEAQQKQRNSSVLKPERMDDAWQKHRSSGW